MNNEQFNVEIRHYGETYFIMLKLNLTAYIITTINEKT